MKAVVIDKFGGEDQLKIKDVPVPVPKPSEVLIEIKYTSVNPVDWKIREGMLKEAMPHRFPLILGWDAAGVIGAMGINVKRFHAGDKVYAYCRKSEVHDGTYAEYVALDERGVALMPRNLSFREAASVPTAGLTAWQALFDYAHFKAGESVLIQGAAGGVGSFAIQFAKIAGAKTIVATARDDHHLYLRSIGADVLIDYTREDVATAMKRYAADGVDVMIDLIGGKTLAESFEVVKANGRIVSTVENPDQEMALVRKIKAMTMLVQGNGGQLAEIAKLIEEGKARPPRIEEFDISQVATAHRKSQSHHTEGKLVLKVH
jgi:NADPH2:quinone reductase